MSFTPEHNFDKTPNRHERRPEQHSGAVEGAWAPGNKVAKIETPNTGMQHLPNLDLMGPESKSQAPNQKLQPQQAGAGNEQKIMDRLVKDGLTPAQSAGVVGNLVQESNADPSKKQFGGGPGFGLAQWGGSRLKDLKNFAKAEGKPVSDLDTQVDFMAHELQTSEKGALDALKNTDTASSAADAFERGFERAGKPNNANRELQANRVLAEYNQTLKNGPNGPSVEFAARTTPNEALA